MTIDTMGTVDAMIDPNLVHNPFDQDEDKYEARIPTATLEIYKYIGETLKRAPDTYVNRASAATMCYKRRWYQKNGYKGSELMPRKMINFLMGDLAEKSVLHFIKHGLVGSGKLYSEIDCGKAIGTFFVQGKEITVYEQELTRANIGGIEVTAHVDAWGKRNSDDKWELIEVKSASNYSFDDFKNRGPDSYLKQANVNLQTERAMALGASEVRFFYLRKETGNLYDRLFSFDSTLAEQVKLEYLITNQAGEPPRPDYTHEPEMMGQGRGKPKLATGRTVLGFPCNYCNMIAHCHPNHVMEWTETRHGFSKPTYFLPKE